MTECFDCKKLRHPAHMRGLVCVECYLHRLENKKEENYRIIQDAEDKRTAISQRQRDNAMRWIN